MKSKLCLFNFLGESLSLTPSGRSTPAAKFGLSYLCGTAVAYSGRFLVLAQVCFDLHLSYGFALSQINTFLTIKK